MNTQNTIRMLDKKTKERIKEQSETYAEEKVCQGYVIGAEAEADRAQGLVECLNSIKAIGHPDQRVLNLIVLTLTKYNNSK